MLPDCPLRIGHQYSDHGLLFIHTCARTGSPTRNANIQINRFIRIYSLRKQLPIIGPLLFLFLLHSVYARKTLSLE